jgi:alpha-L-rhamnosidase
MKSEYLVNPIGIDEPNPRFTWRIKSETPGFSQKAFQLVVGTTEKEVVAGNGSVWTSGTVNSSVVLAVYKGPALQPFTRYFWSVRVLDANNNWTEWSPPAFFETGLMEQTNWKGRG